MKKQPKVSIIIPVYNGSNYVKEAIDSALAQTYPNIEIIVVNDGSNDNGKTREAVLSYGNKVRYFEKQNGGVSTALNFAIEKMTGDYFSWLSHDDMYFPNKIEREIELLKNYDSNTILYSDFELIDGNGNHIADVHQDHKMMEKKPDYAVLRGAIGGITLLIPKEAFKKIGNFPVEHRCVQDYELWFKMTFYYKFVHIPEVLAITRIHAKQDSNTSPLMLSEGNWLWTYMTKNYPLEKKIEYEGSEYLFYKEMACYLKETPYKETVETVTQIAEKLLEQNKNNVKEKTVTVVIENGNNNLKDTLRTLEMQTHNNIEILINAKNNPFKKENISYKTINLDREELLKKCKTDYIVWIKSGTIIENNWLEKQLLNLYLSNKGLAFSILKQETTDSLIDNFIILSSIPFEGIIFDLNKIKKQKIKYQTEMQFLYEITKKIGTTYLEADFLHFASRETTLEKEKELLVLLSQEKEIDDYEFANLAYHIACNYNKTTKKKKIYMYYPCAKYTKLLNSRSFKLYEKLISFKQKLKK